MTRDRSTYWLRILVLTAFLAGCGAERTQVVSFQVAGASGDGPCNLIASVSTPCTTVEVVDTDSREPVALVDNSDAERKQVFKLRFEGNATPSFDIAIQDGRRVDVRIVVYENDGAARFGALLEGVDPSDQNVSIRLYPFREWACPGSAQLVPRALHGARRVGPDQVLIFGGVSGSELDALSLRDPVAFGGPLPVGTIEVYDGRTHSFTAVPVRRADGASTEFRRVLFHSLLVGEEPDEADPSHIRYRIRVIGGYTGPGGSPLMHFDNVGTRAPFGAPFVPSRTAETAAPIDLVYDPREPSVTLEDASFSMATARGGPIDIGDFFGTVGPTDPALAVISLAPDGAGFAPTENVFSYTREGEAADTLRTLSNLRMGPAVLTVSEGFLVWGGNVGGMDLRASAGELFPARDGPSVPVPSPVSVPAPTAFHSWTRPAEGVDRFLIAGGYLIEVDPSTGGTVFNQTPPNPVYYLEVGAGGSVAARVVPSDGYVSTIEHTATVIPDVGVMLVGGASVEPAGAMVGAGNRLAAQEQAALVSGAQLELLPNLAFGRWGQTATVLSGHRLLVVGGFTTDVGGMTTTDMRSLASAELMYWDEAPRDLMPGECESHVEEPPDAAVDRMDAGLPPLSDGGPPPRDAGPPVDAGIDGGTDAMAAADAGDAG